MKFTQTIRRLTSLLPASIGLGMISAFGLKALFTIANFALVTLAARTLGIQTFGDYSLLFSAASLLGIVATFGQQVLVMRFWSEYIASERADLLKGSLLFAALVCLAGGVLIGLPFYLWCAHVYSPAIGGAVAGYLAVVGLLMTTAHLVRTAVSIEAGDGLGNLMLTGPGIAYLVVCLVAGIEPGLAMLFGVMAAGGTIAVMMHLVWIMRALAAKMPTFAHTRPAFETRLWVARSSKLWISNGLEASNQHLDVLIIGFLLHPAVAGAYFVVTRVANVMSVATDAIHMFSTRHIPDLYYRKQLKELDALLDLVGQVTAVVVAGGLLAIVLVGSPLLSIFNSAYVSYHGILIILSIGAAAVAASGPSCAILMLTGHEGRYLAIVGGTVLLRTAGLVALVSLFGVGGGAVATAAALVAMALLLRHSARECTGIDGSVLRLAGWLRRRRAVRLAD